MRRSRLRHGYFSINVVKPDPRREGGRIWVKQTFHDVLYIQQHPFEFGMVNPVLSCIFCEWSFGYNAFVDAISKTEEEIEAMTGKKRVGGTWNDVVEGKVFSCIGKAR